MKALLDGIRVLDLTTILAGPFAAYQLALLGADVIKLERPDGGDPARELGSENPGHVPGLGASFVAQNAAKRSVALDLKTDAGRELFAHLLETADVLVENMRPGVLARLGFPWDRMRALNPRLVYCAITGYGQTGPLATYPAYDQIVQGLAGMAAVTGMPDGGPIRAGFPVADTVGGLTAAMAICAALASRSDRGCMIDVSMLDASLCVMGWAVSNDLVSGEHAARHGNDNVTSSPSGMFQAADGPLNIAANAQSQFESLCRAIGRPDLVSDPRFIERGDRKRHRRELTRELEKSLKTGTAAQWAETLANAGVPAGVVLELHDALDQPQVRWRGLRHEVVLRGDDGPQFAEVLGSPVLIDGEVLSPAAPPPLLGEHTAEIVAELEARSERAGERSIG